MQFLLKNKNFFVIKEFLTLKGVCINNYSGVYCNIAPNVITNAFCASSPCMNGGKVLKIYLLQVKK